MDEVRGIYGGFPEAILDRGATPADFGINAIWRGIGRAEAQGDRAIPPEGVEGLRRVQLDACGPISEGTSRRRADRCGWQESAWAQHQETVAALKKK